MTIHEKHLSVLRTLSADDPSYSSTLLSMLKESIVIGVLGKYNKPVAILVDAFLKNGNVTLQDGSGTQIIETATDLVAFIKSKYK